VRLRLADEQGLYLEVTAAGSKYWRMKYRFADKEKRIAFGVYPEVTLAEARERVEHSRRVLRDGQDPLELRRDRKQKLVAEMADTFEVVARAWFEHWRGARTERHSGYVMRRLELDMFPAIGKLPIRLLTAPHAVQAILAIQKRGAMDIAKRCWNTTGQILRYA
jgi:hypothetical protein